MKDPLKIALYIEQTSSHTRGIARGISLYARTHGPWIFSTIEQPKGGRLVISRRVASPLDSFDHVSGDGIVAYTRDRKILKQLLDSGLPVVNTTLTAEPDLQPPSVYTDDHATGHMVADYFIRRGFRRFAYCGSWLLSAPCSLQRGLGFAEHVRAQGLDVSSFPPLNRPQDIVWKRDYEKIAQWIGSLETPLAVFADNDICGRVLADICRKSGLHVPEEVAIVGADNDELVCEFSNPHLSSVALAKEQVGFEAAVLIEQLIKGETPATLPILVPPLGITTRRSSDTFAVEDPYVARALNFIYHHAGELISVTDILEKFHLSRRSLELRFRKTIGRSPYEEIRRARIERAKKLLSETNLPMDRIAEASGFSETKHFYANFRKETGISPSQHRKQYKIIRQPNAE